MKKTLNSQLPPKNLKLLFIFEKVCPKACRNQIESRSNSETTILFLFIYRVSYSYSIKFEKLLIYFRYYQPFFNIESNDISKRLLYSFKPFKPDFIGLVHKNPDM